MGVVALGEARPSLLPAFLSSPALSPLRLDPDFLRGPNAGGARPSLRSAPDPSRDIPGRLLRNVPMACADMSGEAARLRMSKLVRPSARKETTYYKYCQFYISIVQIQTFKVLQCHLLLCA